MRVRSPRCDELVRALYLGRGPRRPRRQGGDQGAHAAAAAPRALVAARRALSCAAPAAPDEQLMRELRGRFKGEVEALSEYLGRDLVALWGYDRLD